MFRVGSLLGQLSRLTIAEVPTLNSVRGTTNYFVKIPASDLWKSVTSVSNAGRKRGRASAGKRKLSNNLNRGQVLGVGKINMQWPGLTTAVLRGKEVMPQRRLPDDEKRLENSLAQRRPTTSPRQTKLHPLERGWSGVKCGGRKFGPPDPIAGNTFEGFESIVVDLRMSVPMRTSGRVRVHRAVVVVGNGKGLVGYSRAVSSNSRTAIRKAKNQAGQRLAYFDRFENHTIFHDFYAEYSDARLFVTKKQRGYGLCCHRVITAVCQLLGIKDLHAKLDKRSAGAHNLIRAFLIGLNNQRSFQSVAEEKRLHFVELRPENNFYPKVLASPLNAPVRTEEEIALGEVVDFDRIVYDGKVPYQQKKKQPFYMKLKGWEVHLKKKDNLKNRPKARLRLLKKYGTVESFLYKRNKENSDAQQRTNEEL